MKPSYVTRLTIFRTSQTATRGKNLGEIVQCIISGKLEDEFRQAREWVTAVIQEVRQSPGSEQFADDEAIAFEILQLAQERMIKNGQLKPWHKRLV